MILAISLFGKINRVNWDKEVLKKVNRNIFLAESKRSFQ